ncbi:serine hydrolase [Rhizosphaericola mali]|uniref:Serine hydrolase n=1 Tax=Rhizosphaericola mali TaxID=2545455 RepID=A0A5P2G223_9BACT|nr:serine hydrolase [Rhizosphaericola mali]QES89227.1 serine hydrolase [Rhizosphaericola mali]
MKIKLLFTIAFIIALLNVSNAQITTQKIDSLMNKAMTEFNVVGASVAVIADGKIVLEKGYGVKSLTTKEPVNEYTNFQIASNSKAFTATALSILVDEGKIKWDDKVITYIPEFKMYNDYVTQNFIIEDLLCHRSGLGLGAGDLMEFPAGGDFGIEDVLKNLQYFKPVSPFRTKWDYDNQLYLVAGELIKRVSGMSWEEFIQTRIFKPLQMKNSYPANSYIKDFSNVATPHIVNQKEKKTISLYNFNNKINGAAGSIFSNVDDMTKWVQLQLNGGKYGEKSDKILFSKERQDKMWKIHTVMDADFDERYKSHFSGYGLGWFLNDQNGNFVVEHTGGLDGMLSIVRMIPDKKFGIIVLTNTQDGGIYLDYAMANILTDYILNVPKEDWISKYSSRFKNRLKEGDSITEKVWKTVADNKNVKIKNEDYIGIYEDNWFGKCEIFMKGNKLWFKSYRSPQLNGELQYYNANTFAISWEYQGFDADAFAMFTLDENGKAQSIKMKGISPNIDFSFDFQDLDLKRIK